MNQLIFNSLMDLTDKIHKMGLTVIPKSNLKRPSRHGVEQ